jgi:phosphate transport system substrate-binding protein
VWNKRKPGAPPLAKWALAAVAAVALAALPAAFSGCGGKGAAKTVKVSGAYALYPMMTKWVEEYKKVRPDVTIEVSGGGAGKGMADTLAGVVDLGMVSREIKPAEAARGAVYVSVTKDAVVPTINARNPVLARVKARGVTREEFVKIFVTREIKTWGELVGDPTVRDPVKVYTRADSCGAAETWAKYLGDYTQEDLTRAADAGIMNDPDLAAAVENDVFAIGYNNINFAYDIKTGENVAGVAVAPIDLDANGRVDAAENFYAHQAELLEAIASGAYPSPPARDLNVVARGAFEGEAAAFVKWILSDGQQYVPESGYIPLPPQKIAAELEKL